jgi:hypothetical protein
VRKGLVISSFLLLAALSFGAQRHGRGKVAANPGTRHSNAPSGRLCCKNHFIGEPNQSAVPWVSIIQLSIRGFPG